VKGLLPCSLGPGTYDPIGVLLMRIAIGSDHGGYNLKQDIIRYLKASGHNVLDVGCFCPDSCDYPEYGRLVAELVSRKSADRGILICKSGIGLSIVANKIKGVRAASCYNVSQAKSSREHNEANVLSLGALYTDKNLAKRIVSVWLKAKPAGGRHARRVRQITQIEKKQMSPRVPFDSAQGPSRRVPSLSRDRS
jgi:ribose 5-phosphate isomerase B